LPANIFKSLLKYASYTEKKPRENIFTGAFAFLLTENNGLRRSFIKYLLNEYKKKYPKFQIPTRISLEKLEVSPQASHRRPRFVEKAGKDIIDIEIGDIQKRFGIFIENKIGAPLGKRQAEKYWKTLYDLYGENGILAFITESGRHQLSPWSDVYDLFSKYVRQDKNIINHYLLKRFLEYMKEEGMASFEGFDRKEMIGNQWEVTYNLINKIKSILQDLKLELADMNYKTKSIKVTARDVYFRGIPTSVQQNKTKKLKKWRENRASINFGIFAYYKSTVEEDEFKHNHRQGLCPYVEVWKWYPLKGVKQISLRLKKCGFYMYADGKGFCNDSKTLSDIIGKEKDPKRQQKKLINFYINSLEAVEKSGVIRQLYR
jgi:hypothetical protein